MTTSVQGNLLHRWNLRSAHDLCSSPYPESIMQLQLSHPCTHVCSIRTSLSPLTSCKERGLCFWSYAAEFCRPLADSKGRNSCTNSTSVRDICPYKAETCTTIEANTARPAREGQRVQVQCGANTCILRDPQGLLPIEELAEPFSASGCATGGKALCCIHITVCSIVVQRAAMGVRD